MDAVLIARFSPGWTATAVNAVYAAVRGAGWFTGRAGLASRKMGPVRLAGVCKNHLPLPSGFFLYTPNLLIPPEKQ